jgi:hypothetical protein
MSETTDLLAQLDEARDALIARVRAAPPEALKQRPPDGAWSIVENVRHLIYAEDRHLGRLFVPGHAYSPVGQHNNGKPHRNGVGTRPTDDLDEVLAAWDAVHVGVRDAIPANEDAERALERNLGHLRTHVRVIDRLLAAQSSEG